MGVPNDYWAIGADTENRMRAKSSKRHEFGSRIFSLHNLIASTGIGPQPGEGKGKGKAPTTVELLRCVAEINSCYCCQDSTMYDSYDVHAVAVCKWNWNWNAYALVCNFLLFLQYSSIRTRTHTHTTTYIYAIFFGHSTTRTFRFFHINQSFCSVGFFFFFAQFHILPSGTRGIRYIECEKVSVSESIYGTLVSEWMNGNALSLKQTNLAVC